MTARILATIRIFLILGLLWSHAQVQADPSHTILFDRPAEKWQEALPLGNGTLGAMVFGRILEDRYQFNEDTLWSGHPHDYSNKGAVEHLNAIRQLIFEGKQKEAETLAMQKFMSIPLRQEAYLAFGNLKVRMPDHGTVENYQRFLDLPTATATVRYEADGVRYQRECFSSAPDKVLVIRYTADKPGKISMELTQDSPHPVHQVKAIDGQVHLSGKSTPKLNSDREAVLTFHSISSVEAKGGTMETGEKSVTVRNANEVIIRLVAATSFIDYKTVGADPEERCETMLNQVLKRDYKAMHKRHVKDVSALYGRSEINLGEGENSGLAMPQRLEEFQKTPEKDPALIALGYHYGRYLLMSSSRPGSQPANLQGIWNDSLNPAWESKYTCNINTEMNYWLAEICSLSECHEPLLKLIEEVAESGRKVAKEHYGADGWVMHHNTDLWRGAAPINASNHGIWPTGGAWLCQHLWLRYVYTEDESFLRERAYPVLKGACEFFLDHLIEDPRSPEKYLISTPSNSPEQGGLVAGPTMDHQIIRSLMRNTAKASGILEVDPEFRRKLRETAARIAPNKIGQYGQLQEWLEDRDDPNNKHRHVSHLWALHPGNEITRYGTPDLFEACKVTLAHRGDDGTGWAMGWKINFWARLQNGDHAMMLIQNKLRPAIEGGHALGGGGTYPNLFDAHPPFQIDGNFGFASGVAEMLLQSHTSEIHLLPALPASWKEGSIKGLRARGNIGVDLKWKEGKLARATLTAARDKTVTVRLGEHTREIALKAARPRVIRTF
ncbi:glycosyl hydrolase family 95 catalytic domain-containing protein [Haloferula sp. A504]|uniref:glycoside hydrolase family 95 protein n=1 Tax=Haloferula sp. A504 TaxID=3373601 RepID=UPI0031BE3850|nr:glycoside hydrolase family 95 protein [Verrucomicrobiaceae bacterium E54]